MVPLIAGLMVATAPMALGQDFLRSLETLVDELAAPIVRQPAPQRPAQVEAPQSPEEQADPPPLPMPRPADRVPQVQAEDEGEPEIAPAPEDEITPEPEVVAAPVEAPEPEPERVFQSACPAVLRGLVEARALPPIAHGQCRETSPLEVTGVLSGGRMVPLSSPATLNCEMATGLIDWVEAVDGYVEATADSSLAAIETSTSFACRPRNNVEGADTSEHGFANALDVTGLRLEDGTRIGVLEDWGDEPQGRLLRFAHGAACSGFTTVLGPEANAAHEDHLHLDMGCHGASCTARICE